MKRCPRCESTERLVTERRPNGDTHCKTCGLTGNTSEFLPEPPEVSLPEEMKRPLLKNNPLMKFFGYKHLPEHLQVISKPFHDLAELMCVEMGNNAEGVTALRKLLEAKDCAVRSLL